MTPYYPDPRPDLREDSRSWAMLLAAAHEAAGPGLASTLVYFRRRGTRLVRRSGQPLRLLGETVHGPDAWETVEEYKAEREEFLRPFAGALARALKECDADL